MCVPPRAEALGVCVALLPCPQPPTCLPMLSTRFTFSPSLDQVRSEPDADLTALD